MPETLTCDLCDTPGGVLLWRDERLRVVLVEDPDYPGFCRVIWNAHVKEMTDLDVDERSHLMAVTFEVERLLREVLRPDKINLASLGNMTPHLHWHVIPRWRDDPHFPGPIWSARQREAPARAFPDLEATLRDGLAARLGGSVLR
jgi:diadenosine tetraphosphate (Ap4A) HIT family hydrolase